MLTVPKSLRGVAELVMVEPLEVPAGTLSTLVSVSTLTHLPPTGFRPRSHAQVYLLLPVSVHLPLPQGLAAQSSMSVHVTPDN